MNAHQALAALRDSLSTLYPVRLAEASNRPGAVTCIIAPVRTDYDPMACAPYPFTVTAQVAVLAAATGERALWDLIARADEVAGLIRGAGWWHTGWEPGNEDDQPTLIFTCTTPGHE